MPENKRQHKRIEKPISILFRVEDVVAQKWDMSFVKNISLGGVMFLATNNPQLEKDKILELRVKLPDLAPDVLEIEGTICSVKSTGSSKLCEVRAQFTNVTDVQKKQLSLVQSMIDKEESKKYY